jgi:hypothetical protein
MDKTLTKQEIAKKAIYLFKKFARKKGFWEEYKKLSRPLNAKGITFIDLVFRVITEPIELIQSSRYFCSWPSKYTKNGIKWRDLSYEWAKICVENELWYNKFEAKSYSEASIRNSEGKRCVF